MKTSDFFFELPDHLIAQHPPKERDSSRMLVLDRDRGGLAHKNIRDFPSYIRDTLVVFNNSKVRKARTFGVSESGGKVEFLLLEQREPDLWLVMASKSKKQKEGKVFSFEGGVAGRIMGTEGPYRLVRFDRPVDETYLEQYGHIPLPPYIRREDSPEDARRYQTVYAQNTGSVAAPTAGLHFSQDLMEEIRKAAGDVAWVTLHVGLGTFLPVRTENLEDHRMHRENYDIAREDAEKINRALEEKRKILAVGTTSLRCLESAWNQGRVREGRRSTEIFIYPGYRFNVVNRLLTNFHTPGSTLMMLVSALAGKDVILAAYEEAKCQNYRFFSYGDAMLIL